VFGVGPAIEVAGAEVFVDVAGDVPVVKGFEVAVVTDAQRV
jgi:hypothetical protein